MARFIGRIHGNRGEATRLGHKVGGMLAEARGWNSGVKVYAMVDENDNDVFEIHSTGGSNAASNPKLIARIVGKTVEVFK